MKSSRCSLWMEALSERLPACDDEQGDWRPPRCDRGEAD